VKGVLGVEKRDGANLEWAPMDVPFPHQSLRLIGFDGLIHDRTVENSDEVKRVTFGVSVLAIRHVVGDEPANGELANFLAF